MAKYFCKTVFAVATLLVMASLYACDSLIYDDLQPCQVRSVVKFRYDYNMKYADAFAHEVESVTLYVAEAESGIIVRTYRESGEALRQEDFAIELGLEPGRYQMLAWCGVEQPSTFAIPEGETLQHLTATMEHEYDEMLIAHRYGDIDRLYYGRIDNVTIPEPTPDNEGDNIIMMPLVKDTNNIRIVLQHLSGEAMDKDKFNVRIIDSNSAMDWDNSLLREDIYVHYHAWAIHNASAEIVPSGANSESRAELNATMAELTVPRLMADHNQSALLVIDNADTGENIVCLRLIDALLLAKGYYDRNLSDQEYLDRKDEYSLTFFLDKNLHWLNTVIYIESWRVVLNPDIVL